VLLAGRPAPAAEEPKALLVLTVEDQANEIWSSMPADPGDPRVTLEGGSPECASAALREARAALGQAGGGRMALRTLSLELKVPRAVLGGLARGAPADALAPYITDTARSDHVTQALDAEGCTDGGAFYDLRAAAGSPGRLRLHMLVAGECGCAQAAGASGRQRFHVVGEAELEPGIVERKNVLRLRAKPARYSVLASCGSCEARADPAKPPVQPAALDPCSAPCAPLGKGLLAWQRQPNDAAAKVTELAGKATTLELDISTQRRELDSAQAARRQTRPVLERISALQDRIKNAQAELARVTRASQEIEKYASALKRAADQTGAADQRCQSQCRARQQQRTERSPDQKASSGGGAGPAAAAGGGGLSTGVIVAGGAALAAGGVALAAASGGDEEPEPAGPTGVTGTWVGTRTTTAQVLPPLRCTRVFDERWVITQNGTELRADITVNPQSCGPAPACPQGCMIFTFDRFHPGFLEGDTARFYVFPGLQVPSCLLPLRLQGNTLSGAMPACDTGSVDTLSDVVTLRK
jgi:hypothetical protein